MNRVISKRLKDSSFFVGLICFILIILIISIPFYSIASDGLHLFVAEARYEGKLVGVSYCVTRHPLNLAENISRLKKTLYGENISNFFKIISNITITGSDKSSSCFFGMFRHKLLPKGLRIIDVGFISANSIYLNLSAIPTSARANNSTGSIKLFIIYNENTPLILLDALAIIVLLFSKVAGPNDNNQELHQYIYKRLLALSYLSIFLSIHFVVLLLSFLSITSQLSIVSVILVVAIIILAVYTVPLVSTRTTCGLVRRLKVRYREKRWRVRLLKILFLSVSCNNINGYGYEQRVDRTYRLISLVVLAAFAFLVTELVTPLFLKAVLLSQVSVASSQTLSGIIALIMAIVYAVPFNLLNLARTEAVKAAYDVLVSTGFVFSILEIFIFVVIFKVRILELVMLLAMVALILCYLINS